MRRRSVVSTVQVLDERSDASLRELIGGLLAGSGRADIALTRVRLAALDLREEEIRRARCRVLLGELDASILLDGVGGSESHRSGLRRLAAWLMSERLEVRSAGIGSWTPDFSIYDKSDGVTTCLIGAHYFGSPQLAVGPSVTVVTTDDDAARLLGERFDELWERAHDVAAAILEVVERSARIGSTEDDGGPTGP